MIGGPKWRVMPRANSLDIGRCAVRSAGYGTSCLSAELAIRHLVVMALLICNQGSNLDWTNHIIYLPASHLHPRFKISFLASVCFPYLFHA